VDCYQIGQVVRVWPGQTGVSRRVEITRPDGSLLTIDWDRKPVSLRPGMIGVWRWRMYLRGGQGTSTETGAFEVVGGGQVRMLDRIRGHLARLMGKA
jgi:hypothetical protein